MEYINIYLFITEKQIPALEIYTLNQKSYFVFVRLDTLLFML